jgi:hypothetical protein
MMARKDAQPGAKATAADRRQQSFELHRAGASYRAIGAQLNISEAQAYRDVQAVLARLAEMELANAAEYRTLELARLNALLLKTWQQVQTGNLKAIGMALRISESMRKLLGLDAAPKVPLNPDGTPYQQAYLELRTFVLNYLPPEQRLLLAEQLTQTEDVTDGDEPEN